MSFFTGFITSRRCAFSMLFRGKIHGLLFKNADKTNVNAEPAPAKTETKKEGK